MTPEQASRFTFIINDFGDWLAQDGDDDTRYHEVSAIIRNEMVDEWCAPVRHPALRSQLDFLDHLLDKISDRRRSTGAIIAARLQTMLAEHLH